MIMVVALVTIVGMVGLALVALLRVDRQDIHQVVRDLRPADQEKSAPPRRVTVRDPAGAHRALPHGRLRADYDGRQMAIRPWAGKPHQGLSAEGLRPGYATTMGLSCTPACTEIHDGDMILGRYESQNLSGRVPVVL
jgi:hypothetical protein